MEGWGSIPLVFCSKSKSDVEANDCYAFVIKYVLYKMAICLINGVLFICFYTSIELKQFIQYADKRQEIIRNLCGGSMSVVMLKGGLYFITCTKRMIFQCDKKQIGFSHQT